MLVSPEVSFRQIVGLNDDIQERKQVGHCTSVGHNYVAGCIPNCISYCSTSCETIHALGKSGQLPRMLMMPRDGV